VGGFIGLDPCEIDEAALDVGTNELHARTIAHVESLVSVHDLPSAAGRAIRTHVPFADAPVTMASNRSPIRDCRRSAAADFRTRRSTLVALSSISVQCRASSPSSPLP
jgi:hypothetical protein